MNLSAVLCAGRVYCDVIFSGLAHFPKPGEEVYAEKLSLHAGGGAGITAHHLAGLGHEVHLLSNLPSPPFNDIIRHELKDSISLQYCSYNESVDAQVTAVLTGDMDRSFVTRRSGSAIPDHYARSIELIRQAESVRHLHIGELATLVECPELLPLARAANWTISLDCAWDTDAMSAPEALSLIKAVDVFLPNDAEMAYLEEVGISVHSASLTVVKKGSAGAVAYSAEGESVAPAKKVDCVDATGAGDAFNAGFLHAWTQGQVIEQCLESGNRSGALAVSQLSGVTA